MLPVTNTTLDLLVLELVLHAACLWLLLLGILAPVGAWAENDVLTNRCGIGCDYHG